MLAQHALAGRLGNKSVKIAALDELAMFCGFGKFLSLIP